VLGRYAAPLIRTDARVSARYERERVSAYADELADQADALRLAGLPFSSVMVVPTWALQS